MPPPHLHHGVRVVLDFVLFSKLVRSTNALYAISVRRCRILLSASFRFHLTMDTLAVQLMVPTTKPIADFHRLVTAHAGQTKKSIHRTSSSANAFFATPYSHANVFVAALPGSGAAQHVTKNRLILLKQLPCAASSSFVRLKNAQTGKISLPSQTVIKQPYLSNSFM